MDIKDYPIFEVGTWNGMEFTEEDIEDIARNFKELEKVQHVPLKLGHNDAQKVTDGQPALGWVRNLRKVGKQLVADFVDVPKIIKDAIAKRLYRAVSIELLLGAKHGEKVYNHILDAVALLGADQPAVATLPDLQAYLASRTSTGRRIVFKVNAGKRDQDNSQARALQRQLENLHRDVASYTTKSKVDSLISK